MSFLSRMFKKKEPSIKNYDDFWKWFQVNERRFFQVIKGRENVDRDFVGKVFEKLGELNDGFFILAGMMDDKTAELILTADGNVRNIAHVEDLVRTAPSISGWRFTALKPARPMDDANIIMDNYVFDDETLSFYSNDDPNYPDEIDITIVHRDFTEENEESITAGTYVFIDNYIGELNSVLTIDNLVVLGMEDAKKELVPIAKLKDFLIWRQKEFIEKYEGTLQNTEDAQFSGFEADLESGNKLIAIINADILNWESKASHPWILKVKITYNGQENNGMPDEATYVLLNEIEDKILEDLKDADGYLNIGRQTADSVRQIYFACKDFRKPSRVASQLVKIYPGLNIEYDLYKDKYWRSFDRFR